ncbi:unnamed protein product [Allacma fusca]|uniref:Uncharacterized protein n=1 Tax=Allacma fusca TaxID=39272 RepID=A0A8J2PZB2_9HEXA|nr:unnamed protein product [Allacma fusca]
MKFLIFLTLFACGQAIIQEIIIRENVTETEGISYIFQRPVPDTTVDTYDFIKDIMYFCHNTRIELYSKINFEGTFSGIHFSSGCHDVNMTAFKSFRFFGNRDTTIDAVSLFPGTNLRGEEILVDRSPFGGITENIASVAYSGNSGWTVFEGRNFSGNTACLPAWGTTNTNAYNELSSLNITTIGSLVKGCEANVTPEMRAQLRMLAFNIVYFCHNTRIVLYSNINFEGATIGDHSVAGCHDVNMTSFKSFRFFGNRDTTIDTVSLFPESNLKGAEILVDRSPFGGVTENIASVAYSGNSGWTVFEGINFSGKTACLPESGCVANDIVRFCHNTRAVLYSNINYEGIAFLNCAVMGCHRDDYADIKLYKPIRFFGSPETVNDAIRLFPEPDLRESIVIAIPCDIFNRGDNFVNCIKNIPKVLPPPDNYHTS